MRTTEGMPHLTRTVAIYMNVAYYSLVSPIKVTYDTSSGAIIGSKCKGIHKMLYIFMSAVPQIVLVYFTYISEYGGVEQASKLAPEIDTALYTMSAYCWFCLNAVTKFELWLGCDKATKMLNQIMAVERRLNIPFHRLGVFKHPTLLVSIVYGLIHLTSLNDNFADFVFFDPEWRSVKTFFILIASFWESQVEQFGSRFLIILSGVFLSCSNALKEHVKLPGDYTEVSCLLRLMLEASLSTQKCFGLTIVASCFAVLPYFAHRVQDMFGNSLSHKFSYCHFMTFLILLLYLSAEASSKLHSSFPPHELKTSASRCFFISGQSESLRRRKLLLLDVISREGLGLRGRCMNLNYTFFSNIMASILAYSISIMQFQSGSSVEFSSEMIDASATLTPKL